MRTVWWY